MCLLRSPWRCRCSALDVEGTWRTVAARRTGKGRGRGRQRANLHADALDIARGQAHPERQAQQSGGHPVGYRHVAGHFPVAPAGLRGMQWLVVRRALDALLQESIHQLLALLRRGGHEVEDVAVVLDGGRRGTGMERLLVPPPQLPALPKDMVELLHLGPQEGGAELADEAGGADVDPGVVRHLVAEEAGPIGAVFPDDLGALDIFRGVDEQGAALAALDVLGLVERQGGQVADAAQLPPLVGGADGVGRILDDDEAVFFGNRHDGVHLAGDAAVVHRHDGAGTRGDRGGDAAFIDVERVVADVNEDRDPAAQHEGVRHGGEGEGRHDDFVAGPDAGEQCGHLERGGAGGREEGPVTAGQRLQPLLAGSGVVAAGRSPLVFQGLGDMPELVARGPWVVEGDHGAPGLTPAAA